MEGNIYAYYSQVYIIYITGATKRSIADDFFPMLEFIIVPLIGK